MAESPRLHHAVVGGRSRRVAGRFPQRVIQTLWFNWEPGALVDVSISLATDSHTA